MSQLKINFKNNPEQVELIKAIGSKNRTESMQAMEALADFISPVANRVLSLAGSANVLYETTPYNEDDNPSIPLDLFWNEKVGYITCWQQTIAGGLPSSQTYGMEELKVATWRIDSAMSVAKKYARRARLDVIAKSITKMLNEVLVKSELNGWAVVLKAVAEASHNALSHVIAATTANVFQLDDLNRLLTRTDRINTAFNGGTPADFTASMITDLFVSPEVMEQVRGFAYQPMNTRSVSNGSNWATAVPLTDSMRESVYNNVGMSEIFGVTLHKLLEFGDNTRYNNLFGNFYTAAGGSFTSATDTVIIGFDGSRREGLQKVLAQNAESGAAFVPVADDQFVTRQDKVGMYGSQEQGNVCIDSRILTAITI